MTRESHWVIQTTLQTLTPCCTSAEPFCIQTAAVGKRNYFFSSFSAFDPLLNLSRLPSSQQFSTARLSNCIRTYKLKTAVRHHWYGLKSIPAALCVYLSAAPSWHPPTPLTLWVGSNSLHSVLPRLVNAGGGHKLWKETTYRLHSSFPHAGCWCLMYQSE